MTSTVTEATRTTIATTSYDTVSTTIGVVVILLLFALLIYKELMRACDVRHTRVWIQSLNLVIGPLLMAFGVIMTMRFVDLLR